MNSKDINKNWEACEFKKGILRVEGRRDSAAKRQDDRNDLSSKQQIHQLDLRPGEGKGAKRERKRLSK